MASWKLMSLLLQNSEIDGSRQGFGIAKVLDCVSNFEQIKKIQKREKEMFKE